MLCLAAGPGPDLAAGKAHAERLGLRFDTVDSVLRVLAQVTADDDVIMIADGVLPDRAALIEGLSDRPAVLAFPAEPALAQGFERIDATRAWSGALRTRGDAVARLADLPADCDIASALLRIALQSGARVVELDAALLVESTWQRRVDRRTAQAAERRWVMRQVRPAPFAAPGQALIDRIGLRWAQDLGGGRWWRAPPALAVAAGALAAVAAWAGWLVTGLALLLAASGALSVADIFARVERLGAPLRKPGRAMAIARLARDALLVVILAMQMTTLPSWLGSLLPLVLLGLLGLGEVSAGPRLRALFGDRILLIATLLPFAYLRWSMLVVSALILGALVALHWTARDRHSQLTAD